MVLISQATDQDSLERGSTLMKIKYYDDDNDSKILMCDHSYKYPGFKNYNAPVHCDPPKNEGPLRAQNSAPQPAGSLSKSTADSIN